MSASVMPATVTSLPAGTQLPSAASSTTGTTKINGANTTLTEADFLTLLTTQLENQDPLNPQSPSDLAAEMAQFSTASGVDTLNTTATTNAGIQASNLVGKSVAVPGNTLILGSSGTAQGALSLSAAASDVSLLVTNSSGGVVGVADLGAMAAGNQTFTWNGQGLDGSALPSGNYSYVAKATAAVSGNTATVTPYAVVPVTSVAMGGTNGPMIDVGGGLAPVALGSVQQVF